MNRSDAVKAVIWLDQIAARAKAEAATIRATLDADAHAELAEHGTAPTWRLPDLATVALSVSHETAYVADEAEFVEWVGKQYPTEVQTVRRVRAAWQAEFLSSLEFAAPIAGDGVVALDPDTGWVVEGISMRPGGLPAGLTIRPTREAKQVYGAVAEQSLRRLALNAGPAVTVVLAELGEDELEAARRLAGSEPVGHLEPGEV